MKQGHAGQIVLRGELLSLRSQLMGQCIAKEAALTFHIGRRHGCLVLSGQSDELRPWTLSFLTRVAIWSRRLGLTLAATCSIQREKAVRLSVGTSDGDIPSSLSSFWSSEAASDFPSPASSIRSLSIRSTRSAFGEGASTSFRRSKGFEGSRLSERARRSSIMLISRRGPFFSSQRSNERNSDASRSEDARRSDTRAIGETIARYPTS